MTGCCLGSLVSALIDIIKRVKTFIPHTHIPSCLGMLAGVHMQGRPCFPCLHDLSRYIRK